jgi:hypothetical protein
LFSKKSIPFKAVIMEIFVGPLRKFSRKLHPSNKQVETTSVF